MPTECAGVLAIPLIIGLVEAAKRAGLDSLWATPLAVGLGPTVSVGYVAAGQAAGSQVWLDAVLCGPRKMLSLYAGDCGMKWMSGILGSGQSARSPGYGLL